MSKKQAEQKKIEDQLEKLDLQMAKLNAESAQASAVTKELYLKQIESLSQQRQAVSVKLETFKNSSEEAFEEMSKGLESAVDELQRAFSKALSHF